jgi:hypothetical protein
MEKYKLNNVMSSNNSLHFYYLNNFYNSDGGHKTCDNTINKNYLVPDFTNSKQIDGSYKVVVKNIIAGKGSSDNIIYQKQNDKWILRQVENHAPFHITIVNDNTKNYSYNQSYYNCQFTMFAE